MGSTRRRRNGAVGSQSDHTIKSRQLHRHHHRSSSSSSSSSSCGGGGGSSWNNTNDDDVASAMGKRESIGQERHILFKNDSSRLHRHQKRTAEPTIATAMSDLIWILYGYTRHLCRHMTYYSSKIFKTWAIVLSFAVFVFATTMGLLFLRFLHSEVIPICTPPPSTELSQSIFAEHAGSTTRPLVEYYVHGRGNGHYARSVAIVEQLLSKGVDVRMFIGRATMWRAINEAASGATTTGAGTDTGGRNRDTGRDRNRDTGGTGNVSGFETSSSQSLKDGHTQPYAQRGQLTVTSVASLLPTVSILDSISLALERVLNDCEVSKTTNRYPLLVISDGDLPGMWRARFGSIPSVSVSHGQIFVIGQVPTWVTKDKKMSSAWAKQRVLNGRTSKGADWLIATNFADVPVIGGNGVVARSPIRPEVVRMGQERQQRKEKGVGYMDESGNVLLGGGGSRLIVENTFMDPWQRETINELLFGKDVAKSLQVVKDAIQEKRMSPFADEDMKKLIRRKLVICYFRDKNGDLLTNALLRAGFDVLLFERGYHKGLSYHDEEKKLGQDLIVRQEKKKDVGSAVINDADDENSLRDHWVHILQQHNKHLLDDGRTSTNSMAQAKESSENDNGHIRNKSDTSSQYGKEALDGKEEAKGGVGGGGEIMNNTKSKNQDKSDIPTLTEAVETIRRLLKSTVDDPRIIRVTDMSLFVPLLSIADGVASSAGSQLLSECIYSHLNVLALYRGDDTEQMLNIEFSKHRFDHLVKDKKKKGMKDALNNHSSEGGDEESIENVVHGMSLENFAHFFETISRHSTTKTNTHGKKESILITESEEATLLRTSELKETYNEFKKYITAVRHSPISWSYYHDAAHGIITTTNSSNASETTTNMSNSHKNDNASMAGDGHHDKSLFSVDPFQGMPDAASVIIEILEDLIKNTTPNNNNNNNNNDK